MDGLTRDEQKLEERKLIAYGIEALWEDLQSAVKRAVNAHNDLHRDEARTTLNDSDSAISVAYKYRALDGFTIVDAKLKLSLDREHMLLRITGNPDARGMRGIGEFKIGADLASKTLHFVSNKGDALTALQLADVAVAERFFDKRV